LTVPVRARLLLSIVTCPLVLTAQNYSGVPRANLPYSATFEIKTVRTLADGTTITTTLKTKEARDSQGRTLHQTTRTMPGGSKLTETFVSDLNDRTTTNWSSASTVASVDHLDPGQIRPRSTVFPTKQQARPATARPNDQRETLGTKTILGLVAEGTRLTRVIPAGFEGNDRAMTIVFEQWKSPDLGIMLSSTRDDPRNGHITQEVTELDRGEPDPSLFQPPAGYTLQERNETR
jgi:hypothetical protein